MTFPNIDNPDGYQKKGFAEGAKWIVFKTKRIGKVAEIWARRRGLRSGPSQTSLGIKKSGVERFEWNSIILVSLTCQFYYIDIYFISIRMA
jgi:hypothetical protein